MKTTLQDLYKSSGGIVLIYCALGLIKNIPPLCTYCTVLYCTVLYDTVLQRRVKHRRKTVSDYSGWMLSQSVAAERGAGWQSLDWSMALDWSTTLYTVLYCTVLYGIVHCIVLYSTTLSIVLYDTVWHCTLYQSPIPQTRTSWEHWVILNEGRSPEFDITSFIREALFGVWDTDIILQPINITLCSQLQR